MKTAKEEVRNILDALPDDTSFEEIQYRLQLEQKVRQGREDIREGRVVTQQEARDRLVKWLEK